MSFYRKLVGKVVFAMHAWLVRAAAWWHGWVGGTSILVAHWPAILAGRLVSRKFGGRVDRAVQIVFCWALAQDLAWVIAGDYLSEKWEAEREAADRAYWATARAFGARSTERR